MLCDQMSEIDDAGFNLSGAGAWQTERALALTGVAASAMRCVKFKAGEQVEGVKEIEDGKDARAVFVKWRNLTQRRQGRNSGFVATRVSLRLCVLA